MVNPGEPAMTSLQPRHTRGGGRSTERVAEVQPSSDQEESDTEGAGGVYQYYDLRLLRENIQIIRHYLYWSGRVLVDLRPYYPKWVYRFGKPWFALNHEEAYLFFCSLSLTLHFIAMTAGYALKFIKGKNVVPFEFTTAQTVMEMIMFILTFILFFYLRFKCYFYVYFWMCAKGVYWSSFLYSIVMVINPPWRCVDGPIRLVFDIYVTTALLVHSLIDYARLDYTHEVLQEIIKEEMKITGELFARDRLGDIFYEEL